jgi:hypothetical protein
VKTQKFNNHKNKRRKKTEESITILRHNNSTSIRIARAVLKTFRKKVLIKTIMTQGKLYTSKIKLEIQLKRRRISKRGTITPPHKINSREA